MIATTKFHVYSDVSVSITSPVYKNRRKSITIVIDYPDYYHNEFTGFFEVSVLDVDEPPPETPKVLYFDTMREVWEDNRDCLKEEFDFQLLPVEDRR